MLNAKILSESDNIIQFLKGLDLDISKISDKTSMLTAFIHKSYSADFKNDLYQNERLEFLGDSVLGFVISKLLYINHPEFDESAMTLYKIALVREENLAQAARDISLGKMVFLGKGENNSGGRDKDVILADAIEALIGYVYLDLGVIEVEKFIGKYIYNKLDDIKNKNFKSYKTLLQEKIQKEYKEIPEYIDIEFEKDSKNNVLVYKTELYVKGELIGEGYGKNKKTAQEESAKNYFEKLKSKDLYNKK